MKKSFLDKLSFIKVLVRSKYSKPCFVIWLKLLTAQYFIFKVQLSASIHNLSFVIDLSDFVSEFLRRKNFIVSLHFAPPVKV